MSGPSTAVSASATRVDLALAQLREERQRERARRDVLADRELAGPVAEGLAVVAHQVDRRQVRLALHAALAQAADRLVAVDAARERHRVDEPAAHVPALVRAGQLEALDPARAPPVGVGDAGARREHPVEAVELGQADRAGDLGEPVVEAEPVVVEPVHVRRAALVSLAVDALLDGPPRRA